MTRTRVMHIVPHLGVGPLQFGMTRDEVALALDATPAQFVSYYGLVVDDFDGGGLSVAYDADGRCNRISVCRGAGIDWEFDGYLLLSHAAHEVRNWARQRDPDLREEDGFVSTHLGLKMGADWLDEPDLLPDDVDAPAQAFIAFRPGYLDEESVMIAAAQSGHNDDGLPA